MAFVKIIEDDAGNDLVQLYTTHDAYLLPDGSEMFVHAVPAWCRKCKSFSLVELLEPPERMEEVARSFFERHKNSKLPVSRMSAEDHLAIQREVLDQMLHQAAQWRLALRQRTSPPKCLSCGSSDFAKFPDEYGWLVHPTEPERKVRVKEGYIHARMADHGDLFDTEGNRIPGRHASI